MSLPNQLNRTPQHIQQPRRVFNFDNEFDWNRKDGVTQEEVILTVNKLEEKSGSEVDQSTPPSDSHPCSIITEEQFPLSVKRDIIPHPPPTPKQQQQQQHKQIYFRRERKRHFHICFRWPAKLYASAIFIAILALALIQEEYGNAHKLKLIARDYDTATTTCNLKNTKVLVTKSSSYLTATCFNAVRNDSVNVVCELHAETCVRRWSRSALTSISFNTSSIGWNSQPIDGIVWGETVLWIDFWIESLILWTVLFSLLIVFVTLWFILQVVRNRRLMNGDT